MPDLPDDARATQFADYLTDTYISNDAIFPAYLWAEAPSNKRRTTNGLEAFHMHLYKQFYTSHPSIFVLLDVLLKLQTVTYIKIRNIHTAAPERREDREKVSRMIELYRKLSNNEISTLHYLRATGYSNKANTDL